MKRTLIALLSVFTGLVWACSKDDDSYVGTPQYVLSIAAVTGTDQEVDLELETTEEFECSNYAIQTIFRQANQTISLEVGEVVPPTQCLTATGPAKATNRVSDITEDQRITIRTSNQTVSGMLSVDKDHFVLTLENNNIIRLGTDSVDQ